VRCALISDIHSNRYALQPVITSIRRCGVDAVINAGDTFGYYPWAQDVFELLHPIAPYSVLGNHDSLLIGATCPSVVPEYWDAIEHNREHLTQSAWDWLESLTTELSLDLDGRCVRIVHGTPDDPLEGRLYPDHEALDAEWFPSNGQVLVLGHTHYPMVEFTSAAGLLVNPGSVGQPRDGNPSAAWALLDTTSLDVTVIRVEYDRRAAMQELRAVGWNDRSIRALDKTRPGRLSVAVGNQEVDR
jgi:putative phosphoesterase